MDGADASQRESLEESAEQSPVERTLAVATQEPLPPTTLDFVKKPGQRRPVPGDTVVRVVTAQLFIQFVLLLSERQVPIGLAPRVNAPHCSAEAIGGCLEFDNPVTVPGACPIMGESQKVKGSRTIGWWSVAVLGR